MSLLKSMLLLWTWSVDADEFENFSEDVVVNENVEVEDTQDWIDEEESNLKQSNF